MAEKSYDYLFKLIFVGDTDVGKSSIISRFIVNKFSNNYITTVGIDFRIKTIEVRAKTIKLQICDTAGQERYQSITTSYFRGAHGIMLVYDVTNRNSFKNVPKWLNVVKEHAKENVKIMVLGNKCDMTWDRQVPTKKAESIIRDQGINMFLETSAKYHINLDRAFYDMAEAILNEMYPDGFLAVPCNEVFKLDQEKVKAKNLRCC